MFTGIVIEQGVVAEPPPRLRLRAPGIAADAAIGDSVAVDGCCLTITDIDGVVLAFDAVPETLRRTTLGALAAGAAVNLEPALRAGDRMGGHWVQGHVDAVARVESVRRSGADRLVRVVVPEPLRRYVASKGSLTLDGVSLTVAAWEEPRASVALVPYTLEHTIASDYEEGSDVNLEVDLLARYLERLAQSRGLLAPLTPEGT